MKECRAIVEGRISGIKEDDQTASNTLKFILPESSIDKFADLFKEL